MTETENKTKIIMVMVSAITAVRVEAHKIDVVGGHLLCLDDKGYTVAAFAPEQWSYSFEESQQ